MIDGQDHRQDPLPQGSSVGKSILRPERTAPPSTLRLGGGGTSTRSRSSTTVRRSDSADRDVTLRDYAERWLADVALERDKNTVRGYRQNLTSYVPPALGHHRLRSLHRQHIKAFLLDKRREGYAKNSVRLMKALSVLLSDAVDDGIIAVNPALQLGRRKASRADCDRF
jgi:hypothetical protein